MSQVKEKAALSMVMFKHAAWGLTVGYGNCTPGEENARPEALRRQFGAPYPRHPARSHQTPPRRAALGTGRAGAHRDHPPGHSGPTRALPPVGTARSGAHFARHGGPRRLHALAPDPGGLRTRPAPGDRGLPVGQSDPGLRTSPLPAAAGLSR